MLKGKKLVIITLICLLNLVLIATGIIFSKSFFDKGSNNNPTKVNKVELIPEELIPRYNLTPPEPKANRVAFWSEEIKKCVPEEKTMFAFGADTVERCLYEVYVSAANLLEWQDMGEALRQEITRNPLLGNPCHRPAHLAGKAFFESAGGSIRRALSLFDRDTCENGLTHGVIEAWAETNPSDEKAWDIITACQAYANETTKAFCAHGVGHAAFDVKKDPVKAALWCSYLDGESLAQECGQGVLMNTYEPTIKTKYHRNPFDAPKEMKDICSNWPSKDNPGMSVGCAHGAAFVFSKIGLKDVMLLTQDFPFPYPVFEKSLLDELSKAIEKSVDACKTLGELSDKCIGYLALNIPNNPHPILINPQIREAVCKPLGKYEENCVNAYRLLN
jgi:hypothetical protein